MALQVAALATIFSIFFSLQTERTRIVTIHRPIVISQERKTPAFYVYQQAQQVTQEKKQEIVNTDKATKYLSNLSLAGSSEKITTNMLKISRTETIAWIEKQKGTNGEVETKKHLANIPQKSLFEVSPEINYWQGPLATQTENPTTLSPEKKWATVRGKFELIEGVGVLNHYIVLKRIEEGQVREVGQIDLKNGSYAIEIESPRGFLLAQIKDEKGLLIGEDREKLINLQSRGSFLEGPFIRVGQPATVALNSGPRESSTEKVSNQRSVANSASDTKIFSASLFDNQNILDDHTNVVLNVSAFTSTIARTLDLTQIYKSITTIRHAGDKSETPVFTTKWLEGVLQYIIDIQKLSTDIKNKPIIIGRVFQNGKGYSGVDVKIETAPDLHPIYLDQFLIPNANLSATSENGYFMFVGVDAGTYFVSAEKENSILGSQMFIAEDNAIAFQNILTESSAQTKVIRVFDAFSGEPVESEVISTLTTDLIETISGQTQVTSHIEQSVSEAIIRPRNNTEYLPVRYLFNTKKDYIHIPMLKEAWVLSIKNAMAINQLPNTGTIIGFTEEDQYEVFLTQKTDYDSHNVIFFDNLGNPTEAPAKGGGFIMFNVPTGATEVILQEPRSSKIHSQVIHVLNEQHVVLHLKSE